LGYLSCLEAATLKVSPAGFIIHNVTPGRLYNIYQSTGLRLSITNVDDSDRVFALSVHKPSEVGRWEKGYLEIPNPKWCYFEKDEIAIKANKTGTVNLFLQIPDKEKYYNQHWVATLAVMSKEPGLGLGIYVRVQIETKSKDDTKETPAGIIGLKPSTVKFEDIPLGLSERAELTIYNNDDKMHFYQISFLLNSLDKSKQRTYLSSLYQPIPNPEWISIEKHNLKIKPKGFCVIPLKLNIPNKPNHYGKRWEEILFIESDNKTTAFARIQVKTQERPNKNREVK
jgi:hypothetical protein